MRRSLAITPKALNSKAQRRVAHAGLPIIHTVEPQRGSTNIIQNWDWFVVEPRWGSLFFPSLPSVRFATLGFGVELLCSSFQSCDV